MNPGNDDLTLDELKSWNKDLITQEREIHINQGFSFNGNTFDSDERSRANISGACTLALVLLGQGQDFPTTFTWRDQSNNDIPMNATGIIGLTVTAGTYVTTCYGVSWYHKGQIDALSTIEEVQNYDITQGWPS